ncbi:putative PEP-binding protein [Brasilonema sennae]|uniref:putative PEP-binding protein n=1 Tax=Brasilonema sennae TaxID=1397703 RepID=UPI001FE498DB|nr:putative PEP-binding protein [Brasilonema sennae]
MDKLYWLEQIKLQDRAKVGDKAFYLSRIMQRGYPVVPGFVVSAEVLREFLETLNSSEALVADLPYSSLHLDVKNWRQLQQVARRLRQEISAAHLPQHLLSQIVNAAKELKSAYLIFRPTFVLPTIKHGVTKTSGLLESVVCECDEEAIALALKRTWSQMFRAKSLSYWQWAGIDLQQINLGVLVQPFRNAIASGLLNANSSEWEILATSGLGVAMTQGEVLPDVYYIQPETGTVKERQLGNKMVAYRVNDKAPVAALQTVPASGALVSNDSSLVPYLLEEDQQKQYALPEEHLQQLIQLATQIVKETGVNFTFEWTISCEATSTLYLTQMSTPLAIYNFHSIKGLGASAGRVTATAHIIVNAQQKPEQLPKGVILVTPTIAPDWLPLLQQAAGIITDKGGITSHAAILARELGIPAVVSVADATAIIQTGEKLLIDGDKGEVYRLTREAREIGQGEEDTGTKGTQGSYRGTSPVGGFSVKSSQRPSGISFGDAESFGHATRTRTQSPRSGDPHFDKLSAQPAALSHRAGVPQRQTPAEGNPPMPYGQASPEGAKLAGGSIPPADFGATQTPTALALVEESVHRQGEDNTGTSELTEDTKAPGWFPLRKVSVDKGTYLFSASSSSSSRLSLPMITTKLLVNLSQPSLIEQAQSLPVDGVGLLRSELMALNILEGKHPSAWLLEGHRTKLLERWYEQIIHFAQAFAPRPVFYRSLDWRSHELPSLNDNVESSTQSMLGERGTFSYLKNPAVFELELAALAGVQNAGYSNIHLLLPFVRTVEEFSFCRQKVEQARLTQVPQFQLWIMAEVPSVLFLLPEYVKAGVQGISIGTNDLTQLLLAVDREQGQLAKVFDERHPVVMGAVAQLIQMANSAGIPCSICGQAPALYPEIIDQLVQWGITSISVEQEAVERTYLAIARAEQKIILEAARRQRNQQ